jgi:SAM-dependent methyltransferase
MSLVYQIMYLIGFTPWDRGEVPAELSELIEGPDGPAAGRSLDLGCGTGTQAVYMARHGWQVTAVDAVERPLRRARARGASEGVAVDWRRGDVTRLEDLKLAPGFTLFFDRGCYHGLGEPERTAYSASVSALAARGATLLMMAMGRNSVRVGPAGAEESEIVAGFAGWELRSAQPDSGANPPGPMRDVPRRWYRLTRL